MNQLSSNQPYRDPRADLRPWPILSAIEDVDLMLSSKSTPGAIDLIDHLGGFDINLRNNILTSIDNFAHQRGVVLETIYQQILDKKIRAQYPNINFKFDGFSTGSHYKAFVNYRIHPDIKIEHFLCSFNGSDHVGRKLLTAALYRRGWFDSKISTKNFCTDVDIIDGHITDYMGDRARVYRKFFINDSNTDFFNQVYSHGWVRFEHCKNVADLAHIICRCFVHMVSETMSTSYVPYVSEKFLYGIVTRSLFLTYGQPGWHNHVEQYFGFKKYTKIFDYRFDSIVNPVERLVALLDELSKFSNLSADEWHDLYQLEVDTIDYNYDHYYSGGFFRQLENQYDYCA